MIKVRNVSSVPQDIGAGLQLAPGAEGFANEEIIAVGSAIEAGALLAVPSQAEPEPEAEPEPKPKSGRRAATTKTKEDS